MIKNLLMYLRQPKTKIFFYLTIPVVIVSGYFLIYLQNPDAVEKTGQLSDLSEFIQDDQKNVYIPTGVYTVKKDITIKKDQILNLSQGTVIKFYPNSRLYSYGKLFFIGTANEPIILEALDKKNGWRGILIQNSFKNIIDIKLKTKDKFFKDSSEIFLNALSLYNPKFENIFNNVVILNIKAGKKEEPFINNYSAAIEANATKILISNTIMNNIEYGGGIQINESFSILYNNHISGDYVHKDIHLNKSVVLAIGNKIIHDQQKLQCNDGFWIIKSAVYLKKNVVVGKGDDALDIKHSAVLLYKNYLSNNKDEGIDIDVNSMGVSIQNNLVGNSNTIQVTTSLLSSFEDEAIPNLDPIYVARQGSVLNIKNTNCNDKRLCLIFTTKQYKKNSELKILNHNEFMSQLAELKMMKKPVVFSDNKFKDTAISIQSAKNSFDIRSYKEVVVQVSKIDTQVLKLLKKNILD